MKIKNYKFIILIVQFAFFSCSEMKDSIVLSECSIEKAENLEKKLKAGFLEHHGAKELQKAFLPIDSNLIFKKISAYHRKKFHDLPLYSRFYKDDKGNELIIYEWDKISAKMSLDQIDRVKREFEKYHHDYVNQYNYLTELLNSEIGNPLYKDKQLHTNDLEVYKTWNSKQHWVEENSVYELNYVLMPNELYRIILKVLVLKNEVKNLKINK